MKRCFLLLVVMILDACTRPPVAADNGPITHVAFSGPLINARTTMVAAWEFPANPIKDKALDDSKLSNDIRWGFRLFTSTPAEAPQFVPGKISCSNCHLNAGQRERALPLVGIAGAFPEYNKRSAGIP